MCGIAGIIGQYEQGTDAISRMLSALHARGPDDVGTLFTPDAILGQRRLSIIDVDGGRQPIPNEDGTAWVVCNGEIYNYRALRASLLESGHRFSTHSDTEVILHLYEELGPRCVEKLRGMFAFAIWDARKRQLFIARDRLGQKPLFYVQRGRSLFFASEIKALLALEPSLARLNHEGLDQYLSLRIVASPRTMFREIMKLPPAHTLTFEDTGRLRIRRYWDLQYEPKRTFNEDELLDELESRMIDSLRLHMESDVPVGAFMSGGLDSTLLVAMLMKHVVSKPLKTFTIGLPHGRFDEAPHARMVAAQYGTEHHEKVVIPTLHDTLPFLVSRLDEPSDPLSLCTYLVSRLARRHVKVVIGGDGGDELFGGYDRYYGHYYAGHYAQLPATIRRHFIGPLLRHLPDGRWYKSRAHQLKWLQELSFLEDGARYARSLGYFYFAGTDRHSLYGQAMTDNLEAFDPEAVIRRAYETANASEPLDRMLYADSFIRLPDHPVMILDRMTMANSLEARAPFMDHELAEFMARVPTRYKVRGRTLRYLQYRLASRYLPKSILQRPKQGFASALPYLMKDEYRRLFDTFLRRSELAHDGLLRQSAVDTLLSEHYRGLTDHGNRLWLLLNGEIWYRIFIGGESPEDLVEATREFRPHPQLASAEG